MRKLLLIGSIIGLLGSGSLASAAPAAPLNRPLKASQVACAARQLARVQRRMAAYGSVINEAVTDGATSLDARGSLLVLSHTTLGGGIFSGLARIPDLGDGLEPCYNLQNGQVRFAEVD